MTLAATGADIMGIYDRALQLERESRDAYGDYLELSTSDSEHDRSLADAAYTVHRTIWDQYCAAYDAANAAWNVQHPEYLR